MAENITGPEMLPESKCTSIVPYVPEQTDRFSWTDQQLNMLYPLGYEVKHGCLMFKRPQDEKAILELVCNFVAWIVSEVTMYDGQKKTTRLTIAGKHSDGSALREVTIDASEITQNEWIVNNWGMKCIFANRYGIMNQFAHALQHTVFSARHSDKYRVTGWYKDENGWRFLMPYEDDDTVELPSSLRRYGLIRDHDPKSISDVRELLTYPPASKKVIFSLLAITFLSTLMHFLEEANCLPNFVYLLYGKTGSKKSTLAALFLSFFGNFSATTLPQSFRDTANSITRTAYYLKDVMTVVDDIYPSASFDQTKLHIKVQEVLREFSNRTGRGRLNANSTPMESTPPRANAIFTAEYVPDLGESGTARFFQMELDGKEVNNALLTHYQTLAESGAFRKCMNAYIEWIRINFLKDDSKGFSAMLGKAFKDYRDIFQENDPDSHGRVASNFAWLMIGFRMFLKFMVSSGSISKDEADAFSREFIEMLFALAKENAKSVERDDPAVVYIRNLLSLIESGRAVVVERNRKVDVNPNQFVCYEDERCYYVNAEVAYSEVRKFCSAQGVALSLPQTALNKLLAEKGFIETDGIQSTKVVRFGDKTKRVLCIVKEKAKEAENIYG